MAAAYVFRVFSNFLSSEGYTFEADSLLQKNKDSLADRGMEIHIISSASKPVAGWLFRDAIQECREACGGHGYLQGRSGQVKKIIHFFA